MAFCQHIGNLKTSNPRWLIKSVPKEGSERVSVFGEISALAPL